MTDMPLPLPPLSLPRQIVVDGNIRYAGEVVLEGSVLGDVSCVSLVIAKRGAVDGVICADKVTVLGEAAGEIHANHVTLKAACSVTADIFHAKLSLEPGCYFEGKSRRIQHPVDANDWGA